VVRRALRAHNGREIDTAGDGFFATFEQPSEAIACALEVIDRLRPLGIDIRAGVHMGEVEVVGPKVSGITVHVGARVMAKAEAGQVLASSTVRDLMPGADVTFSDEGVHELKGVASQVHLYAVRHDVPPQESIAPITPEEERIGRTRVVLLAAAIVAVAAGTSILVVALQRRDGEEFTLAPNTVVQLDPSDGSVETGVPVGTTPTDLAFDGTNLWVANFDDKTVQRIRVADATADPAQGGILANPTGIAAGGGAVWVTNGFAGQLIRMDPRQANATTPIPLVSGVQGVAYGEDAVWVASPNDGTLLRVDAVTNAQRAIPLPDGAHPEDVTVGGGAVWVTDRDGGQVLQVDPSDLAVTDEIPLLGDRSPSRIAFGDGYVWVSSSESDSVTRIDPTSNATTTIERVGNGPLGIAAGNGLVWVANGLDGTVVQIDPRTAKVVGSTTLGYSPDSVAVTPDGVWVTLHTP
jgi:YVTN family beta-propeller protein